MPFGSAVKFAWDTIASEMDGPGRRSRHCLAYHAADKAIVLFGGIDWSSTGGDLFGDTWEFRDRRWSRVKSPNAPPARHRGAMVYHSQGGYAILFGGQTDLAGFLPWNLGDTWLYADHEWKRWGRLFQAHPSARCGHAFAFDENAGVAVLFGGISPIGKPLGDTWVFDGNSWKRVRGPSPSPRRTRPWPTILNSKAAFSTAAAKTITGDTCSATRGCSTISAGSVWTPLWPVFATTTRWPTTKPQSGWSCSAASQVHTEFFFGPVAVGNQLTRNRCRHGINVRLWFGATT